jgi:hypothetical protein
LEEDMQHEEWASNIYFCLIRKTLRFLKWFILGAFAFSISSCWRLPVCSGTRHTAHVYPYVQHTVKGEKARIRHRWYLTKKSHGQPEKSRDSLRDQLFLSTGL